MSKESVVNLIGIFSPICLMKVKQLLLGLNSGEKLQILIQDFEVINDLERILGCSSDKIIDMKKEQNHFRISILKG